MRGVTIIYLLVLSASVCRAQNQEPSLIDRLLRPNMELKNNAQDKKFTANATTIAKGGTVGTFYLRPNRTEKSFQSVPALKTTQHSSRPFYSGVNDAASTNRIANVSGNFPTGQARDGRELHDANKIVTGGAYPDDRSFREEGKSQKLLTRHNRPLTIDEVRELLNKNK